MVKLFHKDLSGLLSYLHITERLLDSILQYFTHDIFTKNW